MWNATQIAFVVAAGVWGATEVGIAHALAWGVVVGAVARGRHPGAVRARPHARAPRSPSTSGRRRAGRHPAVHPRGHRPRRRSSSSSTSTCSSPACWPSAACRPSPTARCSTCSRSACSAWRWRRPSSPSWRGSAGPARRPSGSACTSGWSASPSTSPSPSPSTCSPATSIVGAAPPAGRVHRRRHPARVVRGRRVRPRPAGHRPARGCSRTASTPSTDPSWWPASPSSGSPSPGSWARFFMFPFDRFAIVDGSVTQIGAIAFRPLPDSLRLVQDGPPRLGVVGLALGRRPVVVGRVPAAQGRPRVADRRPAADGPRRPLVPHRRRRLRDPRRRAAVASPTTSRSSSRPSSCASRPSLVYLVITTVMQVPEATHLVGRLRRRPRRRSRPTALGSAPCSRHSSGGGSTSARRSTRSSTRRPTRRSSSSRPSPRRRTSTGGSRSRPPTSSPTRSRPRCGSTGRWRSSRRSPPTPARPC